MATIKNIIQTVFTSQGANNTVKDVEQLGRAQTRLGQSSASAGRSFAAQSQGLGGLVAAYAGAAATTFALQQAYDKLSKAAQVTQTLEGLKSLAAASGESSSAILKSIQDITKGQLSLAESAQQANLALSAGFSGQQIERLSGVALKASRALGRDLGDAYTRVVRGSAKMETELLDELGIYTKIEPATRAYAAAMGKTVGQLTEFERRQAFANAVITEGERKFKSISTVVPTSAEKLSAFGTKIIDIVTQLGIVIADIVAPLAEFLTNNLAGAFGAVGLAASLVASKGIDVLKGSISSFADSWEQKGNAVRQKIIDLSPAAKKAQKDIANLVSSIDASGTVRFLQQSDADIKRFQDLVSSRNLSAKETQALSKVLKERQKLLVDEGDRLLENKNRQESLLSTLKTTTKEYTKVNGELSKTNNLIKINNDRLAFTDGAYERLGEQAKLTATKTGTAIGTLVSAPVKAGASILKLGASMVSLGANALSVISTLSILGSVISELTGTQDAYNALISKTVTTIKGFFTSIDSNQAKKAFTSLGADALTTLEETSSSLRDIDTFKFTTKTVGIEIEIEKTKEQLVSEVTNALTQAATEGNKTWGESFKSTGARVGAGLGATIGYFAGGAIGTAIGALGGPLAVLGAGLGSTVGTALGAALGASIGAVSDQYFSELPMLADDVANELKSKFGADLFDGIEGEQLSKALQIIEEQVGAAKDLSFQGRLYYESQQQLTISLRKNLDNFREIQQVAEQLGVDAAIVSDKFEVIKKEANGIELKPKLVLEDTKVSIKLVNQEEVLKNLDAVKRKLVDLAKPSKVFVPEVQVDMSQVSNAMGDIGIQYIENTTSTVESTLSSLNDSVQSKLVELQDAQKKLAESQQRLESLKSLGFKGRTEEQAVEFANLQSIVVSLSSNVGVLQQEFDMLSSSYENFKNTYGPGLDLDLNSINEFIEGVKNVNIFSTDAANGGAKLENILADLSAEAKSGAIDLESLSQKKGAIQSLFSALVVDTQKATESLKSLRVVRAGLAAAFLTDSAISPRERSALETLDKEISATQALVDSNNSLLEAEAQRIKALYNQLSPLEEQLSIAKQLKDTFGDLAKPITTVGSKRSDGTLIIDETEKQIAQQEYLSKIITEGSAVYAERNSQIVELNRLTEQGVGGLKLTKDQQVAILGANKDTIDSTIRGLGLNEDLAKVVHSIVTLSQEQLETAKNVETSYAIQENLARQTLEKVKEITKGFKEQLKTLNKELNSFLSEDKIKKISIEAELNQLSADIAVQAIQAEIKKYQDQIALVQAKVDNKKLSATQGATEENALQQKILDAQRDLLDAQYRATQDQIRSDKEVLAERLKADLANINSQLELNKAKVTADMNFLKNQATQQANDLLSQASVLDSFNAKFAKILSSFGASIAGFFKGIPLIGSTIQSSFEAITPEAIDTTPVGTQLQAAIDAAETVGSDLIAGYEDYANTQTTALLEKANLETKLLDGQLKKETDGYNQSIAALDRQGALETELAKKRLDDAKKAGSDAAKKRDEEKKKLQADYKSAIEKTREAFVSVVKDVVDTLGNLVTANLQSKVEAAKINETVANQNLASTSEKLSEANSKQQELMQKEISLRDEIQESYKSLAETQNAYIESLTGDDRSIKQSGQALITSILDQKRKQIDLSRTINERIRQDSFVQSLEGRKLSQEQRLEEATNIRIGAEQKLEQTQNMLSQITSVLSGDMFKLANSLQAMRDAAAGVSEVIQTGAKAGFGVEELSSTVKGLGGTLISSFLTGTLTGPTGILTEAATSLKEAGKALTGAANAGAGSSGLASGVAVGSVMSGAKGAAAGAAGAAGAKVASGFWATAGGAIAGGITGLGVGSIVGLLTNDPGMGSTIGGAVGGAIAAGLNIALPSLFASGTFLGTVTSAVGSAFGAMGLAASLAIPVLGALAGALIGRLFSKTPKASATGEFTSEGFSMTGSYERKVAGGTAKNLADIAGTTLTNFADSLKTIGINFKDVVTTSVNLSKKSITSASLAFAGGQSFERGSSGTSQEDIKDLAQFYLDSFVKGLRKGSLVVDSTVRSAAELQSAIDKFVTEDQSLKTAERLKEVLEYAGNFSTLLEKLGEAVPVTMNDALDKIVEGSKASASAVAAQYNDLKRQAADVFGTTSAQYAQLNKRIKENALSQLGLAKGSDGLLRSIAQAQEELNAGTIAVSNIISGISNFNTALQAAGFTASETANIIKFALNTQLTDFIGKIGEDLQNSIDVLKNPALQASIELESIIKNAQERNKQADGVLEGLRKSEVSISKANLNKAIENVAKSIELGSLEVKTYLESLNIEQLKAVIADENRIDSTTRLAASSRLAALQDEDRTKAAQKFVKVSRDFNKTLAEITNSQSIPQFAGIATSAVEIATTLGKTSIDKFAIDIANAVNSIASGKDIVKSFDKVVSDLNKQYTAGSITSVQYVDALEILKETTLDTISVYNDMKVAIKDTAQEISDIYTGLLDSLANTTDDVGSTLLDLLDTFQSKSLDILKIYDSTLNDLASSGNEIFDLKDAAASAYESAATAVKEFEKANKLSGKSSVEVTDQITQIQSKLDSLSAKPFDFASFLEFGKLTSQQRALQSELNTLSKTEREYSDLLAAREQALLDLSFADAAITTLGDKLIDTRRTESETIQKIQDATVDFTKSQSDLVQITKLLATANFDLNQARFDEQDSVTAIAGLLTDLSNTANTLNSEVSGLDASFLATIKSAAKNAAEIKYAGEQFNSTRAELIKGAIADATAYYNSLVTVGKQITTMTNPFQNIVGPVKLVADELDIYSLQITDRFKGFSESLIQYLDTDGLAVFYGKGGVFEKFKTSMLTTLVTQGFDVLTAKGGPLSGFSEQLGAITIAYSTLEKNGSTLKLSVDSLATGFGNLVTAIGTNDKGVVSAVQVFIRNVTSSSSYTVPTLTTTAGVGKIINDYVKSVNNAGNYTAITISKDAANTLGFLINSYVKSIDNSSKYTALTLSKATGLGLTIDSFLKTLSAGTGLTSTIAITPTAGIGKVIDTYLKALGSGTGLSTISFTSGSGLGLSIENFVKSLVAGTNLTTPALTVSSGLGLSLNNFLKTVGAGTGLTVPTLSPTAGIGLSIEGFLKAMSGGTGLTAASFSATSGLGLAVNNFVKALNAGTGLTVASLTAGSGIGLAIDTFVKSLNAGTGLTAPTLNPTSGIGLALDTFIKAVNGGTGLTGVSLNNTTGLGLAVDNFIKALNAGSGLSAINFTPTSGLGLAVDSFIKAINAGTGLTTASLVPTSGIGLAIDKFLKDINAANGLTTPSFTATAGLGSSLNNYVKAINAGTGIAAPSLIPSSGLGLNLDTFIKAINAGTGITAPSFIATSGLGASINTFVTRLNAGTGLAVPTLTSADGIGKNIQTYIDSIKNTLTPAIGGIADAFTAERTTKVTAFKDAISSIDQVGTTINQTGGLNSSIATLSTNASTANTRVTTLAGTFTTLATNLLKLQDTTSSTGALVKGPITLAQDAIVGLATKLQTAWNAVQFQVQTNLGTGITVNANVGEQDALTRETNRVLGEILWYQARYPAINGVSYQMRSYFSEGGHVKGPGTSTSDSIPAQLSDGEFVIKASAVKNLGVDALNALNSGASLSDVMASYGRYGDTMLAHINTEEASLLKMRGGAGTINPMTNLPEFYNKDGGAIGSIFADQEKNLLWRTYGGMFPTTNEQSRIEAGLPELVNLWANPNTPWGDALGVDQWHHITPGGRGVTAGWEPGDNGLFSPTYKAQLINAQKATMSMTNEMAKARNARTIDFSQFAYAQNWLGYPWATEWFANQSITPFSTIRTGYGPYKDKPDIWKQTLADYPPVEGGWKAKSGQALSQFMNDSMGIGSLPHGNMQVTQSLVNAAVDAANAKNPNFTDFYMLQNTGQGRPTSAMLANGGLVTDDYKSSTLRDSVSAMLEPGEFVLRKQAVDKMGIDNAIRLNSTGETGGDIDVEVNINNNGTAQTTVGLPEVRRENGKIVVDIILEDLRNNGPIKRQIRSIR